MIGKRSLSAGGLGERIEQCGGLFYRLLSPPVRGNVRVIFALLFSFLLHGILLFFVGTESCFSCLRHNLIGQSAQLRLSATIKRSYPRTEEAKSGEGLRSDEANWERSASVIDSPLPDVGRESAPALLSGSVFLPADMLTVRPHVAEIGEFENAETLAVVASGKLILRLWVDDQGNVVNAIVEESDLPDVLREAATRVFLDARFSPGELNGFRVGAIVRLEVSYDDSRINGD